MTETLVFGRNGQLGQSMAACSHHYPDLQLKFAGRNECDFTDLDSILRIIDNEEPDTIVNTAAYTAVDLAETNSDIAKLVNCEAVRTIALAAAKRSLPVVHISTDYVFDGQGAFPYRETDKVGPLGIYGQTKLAGEIALSSVTDAHLIFRTAWGYSPYGDNFLKTIMRLLSTKNEIAVVDDQTGCPTSFLDLAAAILNILPAITRPGFDKFGTYHLCSDAPMTWYQFSIKIQAEASRILGDSWSGTECKIKPVTSESFQQPASRPVNSVMATDKFKACFGFGLPAFRQSLITTLTKLSEGQDHA